MRKDDGNAGQRRYFMNEHVFDYFSFKDEGIPRKKFHKVIVLHECPDVDWENLRDVVPSLPKGWYELCLLSKSDRIQFSLDYWMAKLPYHPKLDLAISRFFGELDDVGCFVTQKKPSDPFLVEMVYSISNNRGFYRGCAPAEEGAIIHLQKLFMEYILPEDYLAFLQIHNGFCKSIDCTGIVSASQVYTTYHQMQSLISKQGTVTTKSGKAIDPNGLIPFYESFGMPYFQCFWDEWHPEQEMGNVYYNGETNTIPDVANSHTNVEKMVFSTFLDWLIFYLEQFDI